MNDLNPNRLLQSLSPETRQLILQQGTPLDLPLRYNFYRSEEKPQDAYFITSGLASIVSTSQEGDVVEVGVVGRDGIIGGVHLLGPAVISSSSFMQMAGTGIKIPYDSLLKMFLSSSEIHRRILEFVQEQMLTVSQVAACNCMHDVEARLARWLLMAEDRVDTKVLNFTQEFLGMMLGSRRTTVTLVAGTLQRLGLIEYSRGRVTILDRTGLEEAACDCYQVVKKLDRNLYKNNAA